MFLLTVSDEEAQITTNYKSVKLLARLVMLGTVRLEIRSFVPTWQLYIIWGFFRTILLKKIGCCKLTALMISISVDFSFGNETAIISACFIYMSRNVNFKVW